MAYLDKYPSANYLPGMQIFYYLFGAITLAAAFQGALAGSMISLVAGGILGALIIAGGFLWGSTTGVILAMLGSFGIAGKFLPDFFKKGRVLWPAGVLGLLGVVGIALAVLRVAGR